MNIMTQLMRIWRPIYISNIVFSARKLSAKGKIREAREELRKVFTITGRKPPSIEVEPYVNILFASLSSQLGNDRDAFLACELAVNQLSSEMELYGYGAEDVRYLLYCCRAILARSTNYSDSIAFKLARSIEIRFSDLRIDLVDLKFRNTFHIDSELGHSYDDYISANSI